MTEGSVNVILSILQGLHISITLLGILLCLLNIGQCLDTCSVARKCFLQSRDANVNFKFIETISGYAMISKMYDGGPLHALYTFALLTYSLFWF